MSINCDNLRAGRAEGRVDDVTFEISALPRCHVPNRRWPSVAVSVVADGDDSLSLRAKLGIVEAGSLVARRLQDPEGASRLDTPDSQSVWDVRGKRRPVRAHCGEGGPTDGERVDASACTSIPNLERLAFDKH